MVCRGAEHKVTATGLPQLRVECSHTGTARAMREMRSRCVALGTTRRAAKKQWSIARAQLTPTICPCATGPRLTPMVSSRLSIVAPLPRPSPPTLFSFRPFPSPPSSSPLSVSDSPDDVGGVVPWLVPTNSSSWGFGGSLWTGDESTQRQK